MAAWTTAVRTWTSGEVLTAANMNAQLRDFANGFGAWASYTPAWTAATTNPVLGNGTLTGAYRQVQKDIAFRAALIAGSTTTYGTGTWFFTVPAAISTGDAQAFMPLGNWSGNPAGARNNGVAIIQTTTQVFLEVGGAATAITNLAPGTWASTNVCTIHGQYEAA